MGQQGSHSHVAVAVIMVLLCRIQTLPPPHHGVSVASTQIIDTENAENPGGGGGEGENRYSQGLRVDNAVDYNMNAHTILLRSGIHVVARGSSAPTLHTNIIIKH